MAHLRNLPANAAVFDVFAAYPDLFGPIADFSQAAFRGEGPLPPRDRELIFSYVSQLNACEYCFGGHSETTVLLGASREVFDKLKIDIDAAPVDAKLKPLLRYAKKLTETPARMTPADAEACYAAGWSCRDRHTARRLLGRMAARRSNSAWTWRCVLLLPKIVRRSKCSAAEDWRRCWID